MKTGIGSPLAALIFLVVLSPLKADLPYPVKMKILRLPDGVRFGIVGERQPRPAPTVLLLAHSLETMQADPHYTDAGRLLTPYGFIGVALDPPAHGEDLRPGEPGGMAGGMVAWRQRLDRGEDFISPFIDHARRVLDYMIKERYTDAARIGVIGISRGGFLAGHLAAADARIKVIVGLSPLVDLMALTEFRGTPRADAAEKLALIHLAPKLAGRSFWVGIGNTDERVDADRAIAFTRALVRASVGLEDHPVVPVELVVGPAVHAGSFGHYSVEQADALAADWILRQFDMPAAIPLRTIP
jgi:esterase FrsA